MEQLIAHLVGDYVLQNHTMAKFKKQHMGVAAVHAFFYGIPFMVLVPSAASWLFIVSTHAVIDHFGIAKYWCEFWGVGEVGSLPLWVARVLKLPQETIEAMDTPSPVWLQVWLLIIVDNTLHLAINYLAIGWL